MSNRLSISSNPSSIVLSIAARYLLIVLAGLGNLIVFYAVFTPATMFAVKSVLSIFSQVIVVGNIIFYNSAMIELIPACVAGSAYYLLFILVFATPNIPAIRRAGLIVFLFASFFVLNVARISIFIAIANTPAFETLHMIFWYFVSTIFVVGLWFLSVKLFNLKSVPAYTDLAALISLKKKLKPLKQLKKRKKPKKRRKHN